MKKILKTTLLLVLLCSKSIQSQSTDIENLSYLGQSISNCGNIYFNLSSTHNIQFDVVLYRPYYDNDPNLGSTGKLRVLYWTGSGEIKEKEYNIGIGSWIISGINATVTKNVSITLNSNDFDNSTGGMLYARFHDTGQNFIYESCEFDIIEPEFNFTYDNLVIPCGNKSSKTFTVTNVNNTPGIPSHSWNVGTGWKRNGTAVSGTFTTTTNSITLEPVSGTTLPSNVSVTATLDGSPYLSETAIVSRSSFNPNYSISGASELCTSATYSINNLPSNLSVTWSSSSTNIVTISPINNYQATLTKAGVGTVTISAIVQNACGQQKTFTKNVVVGEASVDFVMFSNGVGETDYFCTSHVGNTYEIFSETPLTTHQIRLKKYPNLNTVYSPSNNYTGNVGTLNYTPSPGSYLFEVKATNSCGTTDWDGYEVEFLDCSKKGGGEMEYRISPNPTSETLSIKKKQSNGEKIISKSKKNTNASYKLYDSNANLVGKGNVNDETIIDVSNYKKGKYFLKIESSKKSKTYQIIVE